MSITDAQFAALQDAVTRIEGILNVPRYMSTRLGVEDWKKAKNSAPLLPSGDRNVYDRMREIGISQDDIVAAFADVVAQLGDSRKEIASLRAEIAELKASQSTQIPVAPATSFPPQSEWKIGGYGLPMRPLTNGEQRNAIDAYVRGGYNATELEANLVKGVYPLQQPAVIDTVKEVFYRDSTPVADKAALKILLAAIDQRDLQTNALLPLNDPRVVRVSGVLAGSVSQAPAGKTPVVFTDAVVMVNPETGFTNWITTSQNDDGLRIDYNFKYPWESGAPSNPKLPQVLMSVERDGGVSITGTAPQQDANGNPVAKGQYDGLRSKDLVIYPNGFSRDGQGKSRSVDIACMQTGRTLRFGASTATATPTFPLEISPDGVTVNGRPL